MLLRRWLQRLSGVWLVICLGGNSYSQPSPCEADSLQVKRFYALADTPCPWMLRPDLLRQLSQLFRQASTQGLAPQAFPVGYMDSLVNGLLPLRNGADSLAADNRATQAALCYFQALATGEPPASIRYKGLDPTSACIDVAALLASAVNRQSLTPLLPFVEPGAGVYKALRDTLQSLVKIWQDTTAATDSIRSTQKLIGRINALSEAINTVRWLRCLLDKQCILVNIPAATLQYYDQGQLLLTSKVIVGKPSTPTGTLSSMVTEVILYPYWTVPARIASRELLPLIKRNPGYLEANGYQVISNGKIIDAASIDWTRYSSTYFPFTLRQSTGCDNSLGIIKLNFYSPYGLYLHDTPWKVLFNAPKRFLSHGCVRVEKINELARLILKGDSLAFNEIIQKGDSLNSQPTPIRLSVPVPVVIVYETAWPDLYGTVRFFDDIYRRYRRTKNVQ